MHSGRLVVSSERLSLAPMEMKQVMKMPHERSGRRNWQCERRTFRSPVGQGSSG
jgi:hypothetical protein